MCMTILSNKKTKFLTAIKNNRKANNTNVNDVLVSRDELLEVCRILGMVAPPNWIVMDATRRHSRGIYRIDEIVDIDSNENTEYNTPMSNNTMTTNANFDLKTSVLAMTNGDRDSLIPKVSSVYVPWGNYKDIEALINTKNFMTIYITGMSGNGKTTMIEQICANNNRECFRVNIIGTTDEDDLFGGLRLVNGDTVWQDGPVVDAMRRGAILLLDEVDLGSDKLLCLQPVLEGKGVYIKKKNEWVTPADGFAVIATANTKGKGSDDGRFVGTNILNEAFLDRFDYTYEQEYAPKSTEKRILSRMMKKYNLSDDAFIENLTVWAEMLRKSYKDGAVTEVVSTRRLLNIVKAYSVFKNKSKAIEMSLARFDNETKDAFISLYKKIDAPEVIPSDSVKQPENSVDNVEVPF